MIDVPFLAAMRLPDALLIALDNRAYVFFIQPVHFLIRMLHILSASAFFGVVGLLDLRLLGVQGTVPLSSFAKLTMPWLYRAFWLCVVTGLMLFFYDPVHVGSHAFFVPKMLLMLAGMANAWIYQRTSYVEAFAAQETMPASARRAGLLSLLFWTGVMACASLNAESVPKVFLH